MWNGTAEILKHSPAKQQDEPDGEPDAAVGRLGDAGELHRAVKP